LVVVIGGPTAKPLVTNFEPDSVHASSLVLDSANEVVSQTTLAPGCDHDLHVPRVPEFHDEFMSDRAFVNCKTQSSKPCFVPSSYQQVKVLQFLHSHERRLRMSEFHYIQKACGREFTHEAFVSCGKAQALCESHSCDQKHFLDFNCEGQHVWIDAPYAETAQFLLHFLQAKQKSPHNTSACVMLPEWAVTKLQPLLKGWERLFTYQKGALVYESMSGSHQRMPGIPWAMQVWHSPVSIPTELVDQSNMVDKLGSKDRDLDMPDLDGESDSGNEPEPELTFLFNAKMGGTTLKTLMDSGGTIEFMS